MANENIVLREYKKGDEYGIVELFREVFGTHMDIKAWKWKYIESGIGPFISVAEQKGKIVGHYGLVPRRVNFKGTEHISAVVADVIVHPGVRHIFSKRGLFYRLVKFSIDRFTPLEESRRVLLGYGFPQERAKKIGVKLGLYEEVEDALDMSILPSRKPTLYYARPCNLDRIKIEKLWQIMKDELRDKIVNFRDYQTLKWRYSQPNAKFSFLCIFKLYKLVSMVIVREDTYEKKVYDYVGSLDYLDKSLRVVASLYNRVKTRLPPWVSERLKTLRVERIEKVTLVTNAVTGPCAGELSGHFFYTYGDEDV
jgi:predicted N-acetyltransferase YhbS